MAISKAVMEGRKPRVINRGNTEVAVLQKQLINLSEDLNLQQFVANAKASIRSSKPSSCWTIWGGERQLKKQDLDLQQFRMVVQEIELLGLSAEVMARTQAQLFLIPKIVEGIINGHRSQVKLAEKEFLDNLQEIDDKATARKGAIANQKAETNLLNKQAEALERESIAKARRINADTDRVNELTYLIKYIRENKIDSLPPELDAFIIACEAGDPSAFSDFQMMDKLKDIVVRHRTAEALKAENDAGIVGERKKQEGQESKLKEHKVETTIGGNAGLKRGLGGSGN